MIIVMYNPKNGVKVKTIPDFKSQWEKLGFVELVNVTLLAAG